MNEKVLQDIEDVQKIPKCRKHIRKAKMLQSSYARRAKRVQWLETHLHQVKRMKMCEYFGYKVSLHANEKNWRAVHRYEQHGSCIYDMSYYVSLQVDNQISKLIDLIRDLTMRTQLSEQFIEGGQLFESCVFGIDKVLIGPASFMIRPLENRTVRCMLIVFHPSMLTQLQALLTQLYFTYVVRQNEYSIFQLQGVHSDQYIQKLIDQLNPLKYESMQISSDHDIVQYYDFEKQRWSKIQSEPSHTYKKIRTFDDFDEDMQMKPNQKLEQNQTKGCKFWDFSINQNDKLYSERFVVVNRSRFTHRRKRKIAKQKELLESKKQLKGKGKTQPKLKQANEGQVLIDDQAQQKMPDQEQDLSLQKKALKWLLNERITQESINNNKLQADSNKIQEESLIQQSKLKNYDQQSTFLIIITPSQIKLSQFSQGYKIFINQGSGLHVWKLFYQLKLKPIGLRDIRQQALENGVLFFPDDYPRTNSYNQQSDIDYNTKLCKIAKQPYPKRINYFKTLFPCPFKSNWGLLDNNISPIRLKSFQDIPKQLALISQPDSDDLDLLSKGIKKVPIRNQEQSLSTVKNNAKTIDDLMVYEKYISSMNMDRKIIGCDLFYYKLKRVRYIRKFFLKTGPRICFGLYKQLVDLKRNEIDSVIQEFRITILLFW